MRKSVKILLAVTLVTVLLAASAYARIVKTDESDKWASDNGKARQSFNFIVFGDNRPTSPTRPLPEVVDIILKEISFIHPDFAVNVGDLIWGYFGTAKTARDEFSVFTKKIRKYTPDVDMLFVAGNHDTPSEEIAAVYRELFGKKLYYDFTFGNSHFVVIDTNFPRTLLQKGQKYGFYNINDGEHALAMVNWTKKILGKSALHTFVFGHVPVFSALTPNFGKHPKSFTTRENRDDLLKLLLEKNVSAFFAGHEHIFYAQSQGKTKFFTIGGGGAPLYGPTTGGYTHNTGEGPDFKTLKSDPEVEHGGRAKGHHYDLHFPAGALSIFSYMLVSVDKDKVSYNLLVPHSFGVKYLKGNDGISPEASAVIDNRTPYKLTLRGVTFLMPYSNRGYEVSGAYVGFRDWKVKPAKVAPEILEVKKVSDSLAKVRVMATIPGSYSIDVLLKVR